MSQNAESDYMFSDPRFKDTCYVINDDGRRAEFIKSYPSLIVFKTIGAITDEEIEVLEKKELAYRESQDKEKEMDAAQL